LVEPEPGGDPEGEGKAIPYGIYDSQANHGWVNVGTSASTPEFAIASIRDWWRNRWAQTVILRGTTS